MDLQMVLANKGLLETYKSIFIVLVDNVSSQQMHEIRIALRGEGVVLMGKNTMFVRPQLTLQADRQGAPCAEGLHRSVGD